MIALPHGKSKQDAKWDLVNKVVEWAQANPDEAKVQFRESAKEVLDFLGEIEAKLV